MGPWEVEADFHGDVCPQKARDTRRGLEAPLEEVKSGAILLHLARKPEGPSKPVGFCLWILLKTAGRAEPSVRCCFGVH